MNDVLPPDPPEDDITMLPASTSLKRKIGDIPIDAIFTPAIVRKAELVIERQKDKFRDMAVTDITALETAYAGILRDQQWSGLSRNLLADPAFNIKCWAGTFGYALGSEIAKSLYLFCMNTTRLDLRSQGIISAHIHALRTIFSQRITGDGGEKGRKILSELEKIINSV